MSFSITGGPVETSITDHPIAENLTSRAVEAGRRAASTMAGVVQTATQRVRDRDYRGALADIRRFVDERPGAALVTAAVVGFVLARSLARR
jgi:hypothetical protein